MRALNPKYATRLQAVKKSQHSSTGPATESGRALLRRLLGIRNQFPDRVEQVDQQVRDAFERQVSILVLDMTGFSRLTVQHGIIHYLAMIHQMEEAARPAVTGNNGTVIKQEADNLYAVYDKPAQALESALDIFRAFDAVNSVVPLNRDIYGSIGIGYGPSLIIGDEDLFGCEVNFACKLGEDLAVKGEILLTSSAHEALPRGRYVCVPVTYEVSEMKIDCYRYERSHFRKK
ncbi:MAG TPA: adenylate/guanylate cyclase domain-containing protein [Blastocatellia bacterium]|nr:adenylate/guanylate cyclase domain-containing protein [Blastocatellia bacterium]